MQKERVRERRWLLPFTHNLDLSAINAALHLADAGNATLVAVSLISTAQAPRSESVRLELIQQSKDFLALIRSQAQQSEVEFECYEEYAPDVLAQVTQLIRDLHCTGIILATRGKEVLLLHGQELDQLLFHPPTALVLVRLPVQVHERVHMSLGRRILSWWQHWHEYQKVLLVRPSRP